MCINVRIALDPPYPKFSESWVFWNTNERLDQGDAAFVDVIKTTNGTIGLTIPIGHAEYLPNDGSSYQPGCYSMLNPFSSCKFFDGTLTNLLKLLFFFSICDAVLQCPKSDKPQILHIVVR